MKILELHLRNIASIEKADIDFEHDRGLTDPDTGEAAQKFLIFGDTGTGKTVLLDGIAMALFGKTPRTEGIANKTRNTYTGVNGNEINITSIEQYTRLGITEADECYSEVIFTSNDGVDYRAKMQLGLSKKKNGEYKNVKKWLLKIGEADWIEGDKQCSKAIEQAIGMNFEQFNRMAMLAQGQFASFLCGGREERADILEKLTNTSLFSEYGKAIKSLYDKRKKECDIAENVFKNAKGFIMSDEDVKKYECQIEEESAKEKAASSEKKVLSEKISLIAKIEEGAKKRDTAAKRLAELKRMTECEEYLSMTTLCKDWDETDNERKSLADLLASLSTLEQAVQEEEQLKATFATLASDLAWREAESGKEEARIAKEQEWIAAFAERDTLYTEAKVTQSELAQHTRECDNLKTLYKEKQDAEAIVEELEKAEKQAEAEKQRAGDAVKAVQKAIDELSQQRDTLKPKEMDEETRQLSLLRNAYNNLRKDYNEWCKQRAEKEEREKELAKLTETLLTRQNEQHTALNANDKAQKEYARAMSRFATINASLDEKLDALRKQISAGQADICPLCGQKIADTILTREQFAAIVAPYEIEQREARNAAEQTQKALNAAVKAVSETEGQMKTLRDTLNKLTKNINDNGVQIAQRMAKADVIADDANLSIDVKLAQIDEREQILQAKRLQVEELQRTINVKLEEKKPIDEALNAAAGKLAAASEKVTLNCNRIKELGEKATKATVETHQLEKRIDAKLRLWFPNWRDDSKDTAARLERESTEYISRKKSAIESKAALDLQQAQLKNFRSVHDAIASSHHEWTAQAETKEYHCDDLTAEWNRLSAQCSTLSGTLAHCRQTIAHCNEVLDAWRTKSGKNNDYLMALTEKREQVVEARRHIEETASDIKIWQKGLNDATETITEAHKTLGLTEGEAVPDKTETEKLFCEAEAAEKEANQLVTEAKTKIDSDKGFRKKLAEAEAIYEKAKKEYDHWSVLNKRFGGDRFRNLVQTYILRPLLNNANLYLRQITERYTLTCSEENEQLSILVLDRYNRNEVRSAAVLSGGEKFMISLALSLALSSLNRPDMNVNILFIDEGFGTLDQECLNSVMTTLGKLGDMSGQSGRRVGIISHREELLGCIPNKIKLSKIGEGRSKVEIVYEP